MKTLLALCLMSSVAFAAPRPKDLRIEVAKKEAAKLYRGQLPHDAGTGAKVDKVNVLEQQDSYFLIQVVTKSKKNYCLIFSVELTGDQPEISIIANNNEVEGVFIRQCSASPTVDELKQFKTVNAWPVQ